MESPSVLDRNVPWHKRRSFLHHIYISLVSLASHNHHLRISVNPSRLTASIFVQTPIMALEVLYIVCKLSIIPGCLDLSSLQYNRYHRKTYARMRDMRLWQSAAVHNQYGITFQCKCACASDRVVNLKARYQAAILAILPSLPWAAPVT